ncbi:MAG TPA: hypothetical protein VLI90_09975, partial [Tepidisphaeraceae bacterium]|nr:hypothetical protein [Tepidisphaeraceae bacterium]
LMPFFAGGLYRSFFTLPRPTSWRALLRPGMIVPLKSRAGVARACLLITAIALFVGGSTIMTVGMTRVFVPQDLEFMGLTADQIRAINPRLVPLIAHDRAGFGGGLCATGVTVFFCVWCAAPSRSLWQVLCVAGIAGFGTAIFIHPIVGYLSVSHLLPAVCVAVMLVVGLCLSFGPMMRAQRLHSFPPSGESLSGRKELEHA